MKIMVGLSRPTEGEVLISGKPVRTDRDGATSTVGYMPDEPAFSSWMTPLEHLEFLGRFFYGDRETVREKAEESIELFGLEKLKNRRIGGFSKGERQRLALAHAMTGEPAVLIMDEPTSGLDPLGRRQLLDYIDGLKGKMTIIFSTHLLADVDRVCDRVVMIDKGRLIADDTISGLKHRYSGDFIRVEVEGSPEVLLDRIIALDWCERATLKDSGIEIKARDARAAAIEIPALVAELGLGIRNFRTGEPSLEEVFVRVLEDFS